MGENSKQSLTRRLMDSELPGFAIITDRDRYKTAVFGKRERRFPLEEFESALRTAMFEGMDVEGISPEYHPDTGYSVKKMPELKLKIMNGNQQLDCNDDERRLPRKEDTLGIDGRNCTIRCDNGAMYLISQLYIKEMGAGTRDAPILFFWNNALDYMYSEILAKLQPRVKS